MSQVWKKKHRGISQYTIPAKKEKCCFFGNVDKVLAWLVYKGILEQFKQKTMNVFNKNVLKTHSIYLS